MNRWSNRCLRPASEVTENSAQLGQFRRRYPQNFSGNRPVITGLGHLGRGRDPEACAAAC
jgi:hypothetical protein